MYVRRLESGGAQRTGWCVLRDRILAGWGLQSDYSEA